MIDFETYTNHTNVSSSPVVLFNAENRRYYSLDALAAYVYQLVQTPLTLGEICSAVRRVFDVDAAYCEHDIHDLLNQMEAEGLIEARPERGQMAS